MTTRQDSEVTSSQMQEVHQQYSYSVCSGCEAGGRALVELLPVVVFGENGEQRVMALRNSGCNTTLMDESLAVTLRLKGKRWILKFRASILRECSPLNISRSLMLLELEKRKSGTNYET